MNLQNWICGLGLFLLVAGLPVISYLMILYRQLGRVTTGRVHEHLDIFEAELEPRMGMERRKAARSFRLLAHLWLAVLVMVTTQRLLSGEPARAVTQHVSSSHGSRTAKASSRSITLPSATAFASPERDAEV